MEKNIVNDYVLIFWKPMHTSMVGIHRDFCLNLQEIRKAKGFTQDTFADKMNVTKGYIQQLENGYKNGPKTISKTRNRKIRQWPSPPTIAKLAKALGCLENDFFKQRFD